MRLHYSGSGRHAESDRVELPATRQLAARNIRTARALGFKVTTQVRGRRWLCSTDEWRSRTIGNVTLEVR